MKYAIFIPLLFCFSALISQEKTPEDFGCYLLPFYFEKDTVDILIYSKSESYNKKKPLLLFIQGSLPRPLLKYDNQGNNYSVFPFDPQLHFDKYHFAIIGKPGIPLMASIEELSNYNYIDKNTNAFPREYCEGNHLEYYVSRNKAVLEFLATKDWVDSEQIIVVGHSEGVSISFKMALEKAKMSHLVLLNAGLAGRIMSLIINSRLRESISKDSTQTEELFRYWKYLNNKVEFSDDCSMRDSHKATASFSFPYRQRLKEIDLPVFFGYGTKDESVLLMDYLRVQTIQLKKKNFHYKSYFGLEHSFFKVKDNEEVDYEDYRFDLVMKDIFDWLKSK